MLLLTAIVLRASKPDPEGFILASEANKFKSRKLRSI